MSRRRKNKQRQKQKHNHKSVTINKSVKRPKYIRYSVVEISERLNGSSYVDWEIYNNDEIHSNF